MMEAICSSETSVFKEPRGVTSQKETAFFNIFMAKSDTANTRNAEA
jgi:hypothetical protein